MSAPLGLIRPDRQLELLDHKGSRRVLTGEDPSSLLWGSWTESEPNRHRYSWPTWDPQGQRVACLRAAHRGRGAELCVQYLDGVRSDVLLEFGERIPIYLVWSPEGDSLATLYQDKQQLGLMTLDLNKGSQRTLLTGSPLFFTWANNTQLACFVGRPTGAALTLVDRHTGAQSLLPGEPLNFCTPVQLRGRTTYVAHQHDRISVWWADLEEAREIEPVEGLVALMGSPDGRMLARASARDDQSEYQDLAILEVPTGAPENLGLGPCTAFWWTPDSLGLIVAQTHAASGVVTFSYVDVASGSRTVLGEVQPTRDLKFYLRFFEQFALSHPLVSPDGQHLLLAGALDRAEDREGIWKIPLDGGSPVSLGEGLLGVWGPSDSNRTG